MSVFKSNFFLLMAAAIWGFAFVAQRVGMDHLGPFAFTGFRFILGSLSLVPLLLYNRQKPDPSLSHPSLKTVMTAGLLAGTFLFSGASFQQVGLLYTTAGKAAFITCLYIVLVPIFGILLKHKVGLSTWLGSLLAIGGLYLLCIKEGLAISYGDLLELIGSFFWTAHILIIDHFSRRVDVLKLSFFQFITCAFLSLAVSFTIETTSLQNLMDAAVPLFYGGVLSAGVAYTLQAIGQKYAPPSHAAIILSMETVFAVIGGYLFLQEILGVKEIIGCLLMLAGMLLSQLGALQPSKKDSVPT